MLRRHRFVHGIGHVAVGEVAGGAAAQFGDVDGFREIHLEQGALAEAQRNGILGSVFGFFGGALSQEVHGGRGLLHDGVVALADASAVQFFGSIVAVASGESLPDLDATAMAVHVAEAADVHEDVEAELLARAERAQHLVVAATVAQSEVDNLAADSVS